jgi:hypothetical protein
MAETAKQIIERKRGAAKDQARHIRRFCDLRRVVNENVFGFQVPTDCLCDRNGNLPEGWNWQDNGEVMDFIEKAVEEKIARDQ